MQYLMMFSSGSAGEGDLSDILRRRTRELGLHDKVRFLGFIQPGELRRYTAQAWLGINLLENKGVFNDHSLANKFLLRTGRYAGCTMNFPEYKALNEEQEVGILLDGFSSGSVAAAINKLLNDKALYQKLQGNCLSARMLWNWEAEEKILYIFGGKPSQKVDEG